MLLDKGYAIHRILQEAGTEKISDNLTMVPRDIDFETATIPVKDIHDAYRTHHTQKSRLSGFFSEHDIIKCPASHVTAPGAEEGNGWYFSYIMPYNIANWPAAVIPAGITGEGLPYGIQIVGKPWQEHKVLAVAKFHEKKIGGFQPPGI